MEKIRKLSVITGLLLLLAIVVGTLFDPYPVMPFIEKFIENERTINFPLIYFRTAVSAVSVLFLVSIGLFYFYSWKGNRKAIFFLFACYVFEFALMMIEWKPTINLEIINFLTNLNALTDGIILCTLITPAEPAGELSI